jgi:hypothetical protein
MVFGYLRIDKLAAERFEAFERAFLVRPHEPRIARHIGGENCRQPALDAGQPSKLHGVSSVAADYTNRRRTRIKHEVRPATRFFSFIPTAPIVRKFCCSGVRNSLLTGSRFVVPAAR